MQEKRLSFVIPTYRLREVGETVAYYDEHFWRNGHSVPILVFDDSSRANHEKYYALLEQTATHNEVYYVGVQQERLAAAHVDAAQNHCRSNYMRNPPASEILNEEIANLLKRKIRASLSDMDELSISFDYGGEVSAQDAGEILEKIHALHTRALARIVDDVVSVIKGSIELWPTLVEICYFQKGRKGLPVTRVTNPRK
jgi:hypothetical protein